MNGVMMAMITDKVPDLEEAEAKCLFEKGERARIKANGAVGTVVDVTIVDDAVFYLVKRGISSIEPSEREWQMYSCMEAELEKV